MRKKWFYDRTRDVGKIEFNNRIFKSFTRDFDKETDREPTRIVCGFISDTLFDKFESFIDDDNLLKYDKMRKDLFLSEEMYWTIYYILRNMSIVRELYMKQCYNCLKDVNVGNVNDIFGDKMICLCGYNNKVRIDNPDKPFKSTGLEEVICALEVINWHRLPNGEMYDMDYWKYDAVAIDFKRYHYYKDIDLYIDDKGENSYLHDEMLDLYIREDGVSAQMENDWDSAFDNVGRIGVRKIWEDNK